MTRSIPQAEAASCPAEAPRHRRHTPALSLAIRQRNQRVERYRDLVRPVAMHYAQCCSETREDLIQVGLLGLIRAAELYRHDMGTPFEAFARPHIRGAILHYLRDDAPSVRLPRRQAERQERLLRLERHNAAQGMGDADLQGRLGIEAEQWRLLMQYRRLNRPLPLEDQPLEELAAPECQEQEERLVPVAVLLKRLDPRQRQVVRQVVLAGWSYRKLASEMKISPMTVQRLLHRGLERLRQQLEEQPLRASRRGSRAESGVPAC
ncbi:MAG: sigma-70 family RNA polymerase sigma factor [Cyanobium sp.]